ncbi:sigma 54-interacting transcriptional regulator [Burkholderia sp. Ac-20353]|uniref:sigma-54 interaction domain-containing protein n=1 Tax=Burkholderia sp. Ac-20353 TaxID=2703894 RepID=UPI00197C2365|nr:sigma 54-interacting transcriptional regulator [Burkholderia sp. Ac-20353]MBN3788736.1 AAA domain-containing protein [Burkholderia sp. Ac-20353]
MDEQNPRAAERASDLKSAIDSDCWRDARRTAALRFRTYVLAVSDDAVALESSSPGSGEDLAACCRIDIDNQDCAGILDAARQVQPADCAASVAVQLADRQLECAVASVNWGSSELFLIAFRRRESEAQPLDDLMALLRVTFGVTVKSYFDLIAHQTLVEEQKAIIDHIGDGLMVLGRGGVVRHASTVAGHILGIDPVKSIGKPLGDLIDFEPIIAPIFTTGAGYVDRELIIDSPARHLHLMDTAIPIKNSCGQVVSVVNTFREIKRVRKIAGKYAGNYARYTFESIVGQSESLLAAVSAARKAARGSANLLLSGESGVGKEVFAQAIHNASSRNAQSFIAINCAALPHDLIESELFGHAPGSFTGATRDGRPGKFESADGGTVFLDEISELPIDVQAKLLRVLQEREVTRLGDTRGIPIDVRIICASNRDLAAMVAAKEFREDLYYRCNVIEIAIPPLRSRREDITATANFFLRKYAALLDKHIFGFSEQALAQMNDYDWPGNVRELENLVERVVNLSDDEVICDVSVLLRPQRGASGGKADGPPKDPGDSTESRGHQQVQPLKDVERDAISRALAACQFNVTRCAAVLEISKPALYAKVKRYRIKLERPIH